MSGEDKGMLQLNGHTLAETTVKNLQPQVSFVVISANRNLEFYQSLSEHVVPDCCADFKGPLTGVLSVMSYLQALLANKENTPEIVNTDLLIVPCDMPLLPVNLAQQMQRARDASHQQTPVIVNDGDHVHPLCCLLPLAKKSNLEAYLKHNHHKARQWMSSMDAIIADFSKEKSKFININTPEDLLLIQ